MGTFSQVANRRSRKSRLLSATSFALEAMESRVMLSTTFTAWTFDQLTVTTTPNLSPAPSTGSGTALTVGMQTSSSNTYSPGGVYAYPNANASGTGDISDVLNGTGNNPSGNQLDHSSTGNNTAGNSTNPAWRVRGSSDGWSANAALVSQGAQFITSTSGYSGVTVSFDLDPSSGSAPSEIAVEYTTDGGNWTLVPAADLGTPTSATGNTTDVTVATNSSNGNIVNGAYYQFANSGTTPDALYWQNGFTVNLSGISAVNNNANFGIRIVNAATGSAEYEVGGTAFPAAGAGNWRLDNIDFTASGGTLTVPVVTTQPGNTTVPAGNTATFTAAASGNPTPTVQWQVSTNSGSTWGNDTTDAGNTTGTLTITTSLTAADNGNEYRAVFNNSQGNATSNAATLTDTLAAPAITLQPTTIATTAGGTISFSAAATGSPVPTVQWQDSTNGGSTWGNISGATSTTYSFTSISSENNYEYRAVFTNSSGTATSSAATLLLGGSVITGWNFGALTAGQTILSPTPSTGTGTASSLGMGSVGTYSVYPGDPAAAFTLTVHDSGGNYTTGSIATGTSAASIQTTLRALHSATTGSITVTTNPTASAAAGVLLTGDTGATLTGNGTGTGFFVALDNSALPTAQVTGNPDDSNIVAAADTGSPNADSSNTNAWRIVGTNGWNSAAPIGTQGAQFLASTSGYTSIEASFDLYATAQGEGRIQVEYTTNGSTWTNVPAVDLSIGSGDTGIAVGNNSTSGNTTTGGFFNITAASANSWYNSLGVNLTGISGVNNNANFGVRIVNASTGGDCVNITGAALNNSSGNDRLGNIQITGNNPAAPVIITNPVSQALAAGNTATFTAAALGYPAPTVQWMVSTNGGSSWSIDTTDAGNTTTSLQVVASSANSGDEYEAVFTNTVGNATTTAATLSVGPAITTQPTTTGNLTVNAGTSVTLSAAAVGTPTPTMQWQISTNGGSTWGNISGATSGNYTFTANENLTGDEYKAVFTNSAGNAITNTVTLTVVGTPVAQWIFPGGEAPTAGGSTAAGTGNDPYPTFGPLTNTAGTLGLENDYTGIQAFPESDILIERSTLNPGYSEYDWRIRSGDGAGPTGSPGTPEGWSQDAPEYAQGVQFDINTTGYTNVTFQFDWNQGGISDMQAQYSPNGGTTWYNAPNGLIEENGSDFYGITATTSPTPILINLQGIAAANNNPDFELQLVAAYNPSLPQIDDGNQLDPTVHGQYATGAPGAVNAQQVITLDNSVAGGNFTLTYNGNTTGPIAYDSNPTNEIADITAALTPLLGAGNFAVAQTNSVAAGWNPAGGPTAPYRDIVGNPFTVTFQGSLAATPITTMVAHGGNLTGGNVSVATWVNGSPDGFKPYVDGGGAWQIGQMTFNGDSTGSNGLAVMTQPASITVTGGTAATFTATAYDEAAGATAQWQVSTDGTDWSNLGGNSTNIVSGNGSIYTSTYTFTTDQNLDQSGNEYRVVFTQGASSVASSPAILTVVAPQTPAVTLQPVNTAVEVGDVALFSATASGDPTPTVQWQLSTDGGSTWTNLTNNLGNATVSAVSGVTTSYLSFTSLDNTSQSGYEFRAVFTNEVSTIDSAAVTLTVLAAETNLTTWDFSTHATSGNATFDNSPSPTGGVVDIGTALPVGMTVAYNPSDPASGTDGNGSVPACDVTNSPGSLNPSFNENTWRIRGGVTAATGGTPANGWSNLAPEYTQGVQFSVPTTGYNRVYVTMDWYATTSGILDGQEQYTIDGSTWINLPGGHVQAVSNDFYGATATGGPVPLVFDLTNITGVANNPNFGVRLVSAYNPQLPDVTDINGTHGQYANAALVGTPPGPAPYNGSKGNWRFDNIEVHGLTLVTTPPWLSVATGGNVTWSSGNETLTVNSGNFTITGDPGQSGDDPTIIDNSPSSNIVIDTQVADGGDGDSVVHIASITGNGTTTVIGTNVVVTGNFNQGALVNNGAVVLEGNSSVAQLTGSGNLTVGTGDSGNTFQITPASTPDSVTNTQQALTVTVGSTLDITNNKLLLDYGSGSSPLAAVQSEVANGAGAIGALDTTGSILSSTANAGQAGQFTVGFADSTELGAIPSGNVEMMYTLSGDAFLIGTVNFTDYSVLQNAYNQSGTDWAQGDYTHNGSVTFNDYSLLQNNYNQGFGFSGSVFSSVKIASAKANSAAPVANIAADVVVGVYTPATANLFATNAATLDLVQQSIIA